MSDPSIGQRIFLARKAAGIKQKELAHSLGLTPTALNYYEKGKRTPSIEVLKQISSLLTISMDYLLGLEEAGAAPLKAALASGEAAAAAGVLGLPGTALRLAEGNLILGSSEAVPYQSQASRYVSGGLSYQDLAQILCSRQPGTASATRLAGTARLLQLLAATSEENLAKLLAMAEILLDDKNG